jgi:hypothetical protein
MDAREFAGLELAARAKIVRHPTFWLVPSLASRGSYRVSAGEAAIPAAGRWRSTRWSA